MIKRREFHGLATGSLAVLAARPALAQEAYPDRPIRFIVPFPAGGATDIWARLIAEAMSPMLGQPIVIENRGGAGSMIGTESVARAAPDGYTLLFSISSHYQAPVVMRRFPFDPVADFAPIGRVGTTALLLCISPKVPAEITDMAGFVAWAQGRDLSLGAYAPGSSGHAYALLLAEAAKLKAEVVAYRGEAPMLQDMLSGVVHAGFHSMAGAGEMIRGGRLRAIGAVGDSPPPSLPRMPLLKDLGYPSLISFGGFAGGLLAPARTPQPILDRLSTTFKAVMDKPEVQQRLIALDTTPAYLGPAEFREEIIKSMKLWSEVTERLNLRVEG